MIDIQPTGDRDEKDLFVLGSRDEAFDRLREKLLALGVQLAALIPASYPEFGEHPADGEPLYELPDRFFQFVDALAGVAVLPV